MNEAGPPPLDSSPPLFSPTDHLRETDALNPNNEKTAKTASQSVTSINKSLGSSEDSKNFTEWLPYTLRWSLVWIPTVLSLILGLVVGLLYWRSDKNHGLCSEESAVTGWRFAPTLVAVVYAQLITMLFNDIQRTEPFARLARPSDHAPPASRTILEGPRQVWTAFAHAFNKKHNGGKRSWIIIWISVVLVLSSVITSLSSALLASEETPVWQPSEMTRLVHPKNSPLEPLVERDTYFRTTGAILQNVTTSPWVSDEFLVLPFWPSGSAAVSPWDAQFPSKPQTWEAETTVFRNDLECSSLELAGTDVWFNNWTYYDMNMHNYPLSIRLENAEGCTYNVTFNDTERTSYSNWEGGSWAEMDAYALQGGYAETSDSVDWNSTQIKPIYNDKCIGDEIIIMSSQWISLDYEPGTNQTAKFLPNLTVTSYICQSTHTMATLPVRVSTSASEFSVDFDVEAFQKAKEEVPSNVFDTSQFVAAYTDPEWWTVIGKLAQQTGARGQANGVLALLAAEYEFDFYKMKNDTNLPQRAARIQRRHFGELLRSSLSARSASQTEGVVGGATASERRITVSREAAAALVALLECSFLAMLGIIWLSRVHRRPLHLAHEPATVLGTVSLVSSNPSVLSSLRELDQASTAELRSTLKGRFFSTSNGHLREVSNDGGEIAERTPRIPTLAEKETPAWVKVRFLLSLVLYIAILVTAIAVVHRFANGSELKKGFFTYHVNINALGRLGSFTPFSIIPTTLAVLLGLWWNALDSTFRSLQPYVSMSQAPREISRGAYVSYQSSYWLWATGKAAKNRHWLLSIVTFGTFLAQAFTIATSALFEQTTGVINDSVQLNRTLELRQAPHLRQVTTTYPPEFNGFQAVYGYPYVGQALRDLFGNLTNNWLYSGVIQSTLNSSQPVWSMDGWSFVPVDLSDVKNRQNVSNDIDSKNLDAYGSLINVTLTTPAIRGRVECHQVSDVRNGSTTWNTNTTYTTTANKTMEMNVPDYEMFGGPLAPDAMYLSCCYNNTEPSSDSSIPRPLAIGFWTQDFGNASEYVTSTLNNFTVKWIYGDGALQDGLMSGSHTLFFATRPKIQAVKCMPIFEISEAEIVVEKQTGRVLSSRILREPTPDDSAWSNDFVLHDVTDPDDPVFKKQLKDATAECDPDLLEDGYCSPSVSQNLTTSYGNLFMNSFLRASRLNALSSSGVNHGTKSAEQLDDNVFNIRDNVTGLTLDFMSYAAYVQAGRNPQALLDLDYMLESTQKIFTTFFQHYVSSSYSLLTGGWAYQPIGAALADLGDPVNGTMPQHNPDGTLAVKVADLPARNTQRVTDATMSTRVEVLHMNPSAVWLCIAMLAWLAVTTMIVAALQRWYFGELRRNVESIADVLVLVAGSERLLGAVERYGVEGLMKSNVKTRLGWFRTGEGKMRWGIEIVEDGEVLMN